MNDDGDTSQPTNEQTDGEESKAHKKILTWSTILAKTHMSTDCYTITVTIIIIVVIVMKSEGHIRSLCWPEKTETRHVHFFCWCCCYRALQMSFSVSHLVPEAAAVIIITTMDDIIRVWALFGQEIYRRRTGLPHTVDTCRTINSSLLVRLRGCVICLSVCLCHRCHHQLRSL